MIDNSLLRCYAQNKSLRVGDMSGAENWNLVVRRDKRRLEISATWHWSNFSQPQEAPGWGREKELSFFHLGASAASPSFLQPFPTIIQVS